MKKPASCWNRWNPGGLLPLYRTGMKRNICTCLRAVRFSGTLHPCQEGTLQWIPITDVPQLPPVGRGTRLFLSFLARKRPYFSLKLCYQGDSLQQAFLNGQPLPL